MHVKQLTIPCQFWRQLWSFGWFFSLLACSHILHDLIRTSQSSTLPVWVPIIEQCPTVDVKAAYFHKWTYIFEKLTSFEYRNNTVWHYTRNYMCIDKTVFKIIIWHAAHTCLKVYVFYLPVVISFQILIKSSNHL